MAEPILSLENVWKAANTVAHTLTSQERAEELEKELNKERALRAELEKELNKERALRVELEKELDKERASRVELEKELDKERASRLELEKKLEVTDKELTELRGIIIKKFDVQYYQPRSVLKRSADHLASYPGSCSPYDATDDSESYSPPSKKVPKPDDSTMTVEQKLMNIAQSHVNKKWYQIGILLGLSNDKLETIEANYNDKGVIMQAYQMLYEWRKGAYGFNYSTLKQAGYQNLAKLLEDL